MLFLEKIVGDPNARTLGRIKKIADKVNAFEPKVKELTDEALKSSAERLRARLINGETLDDILPEAFALVREAAGRTLGMRHFDVQIMGGIVLHEGKIAEMKTGEGKTLTATLPLFLNALTAPPAGGGAHLVTVNDYLARRDTAWMGQVYDVLGLTVGCITHDESFLYDPGYKVKKESESKEAKEDLKRDVTGSFRVAEDYLRPVSRKEAYAADITYGTNNEFGFDYLRDNMAYRLSDVVQRIPAEGGFHYAIVDEVDSILIDEARTPLIISAPDRDSGSLYKTFAMIAPTLKENEDYNVDEKMRAVSITEPGIAKVEKRLGIKNLYDPQDGGGIRYVHHLEQALRAHILYQKDKDYVVRSSGDAGEVIIVDEFTGRLMPGRRYSEGLHQAIEAKENVKIQQESRTLASITFQNYFRMYRKLSGMTGTAISSAEELDKVYKLDVIAVPTNRPMIRTEYSDSVYRTRSGKYRAAAKKIGELHKKGQPVLVGTTSIERNELISKMLEREGVPHQVLNAKNHEREGEIIAQAGCLGKVTVATNMAGRGVDIILGGNPPDAAEAQKIRELGGLFVLGTERHEARRIDNQLRGRSGRQGDPGASQFFLSLEDDLLRVFGGGRVQQVMQTLRIPEDQPIESRFISGAIESAQKKIEGYNFDARKHVLDYDEVLNKHRSSVYRKRLAVLTADAGGLEVTRHEAFREFAERLTAYHLAGERKDWNMNEIYEVLHTLVKAESDVKSKLQTLTEEIAENEAVQKGIQDFVIDVMEQAYQGKVKNVGGEEKMREAARWIILRTIDMFWMDHLEAMDYMRDSVRLRAYSQRDPLVEYKNESQGMYRQLIAAINASIVETLFRVEIKPAPLEAARAHSGPLPLTGPAPQEKSQVANLKFQGAGDGVSTPANGGLQDKSPKKLGRNDPCYCGSGKKYKKCHGK